MTTKLQAWMWHVQDVMGAVKGLFDMSQLQDALSAVYISTSRYALHWHAAQSAHSCSCHRSMLEMVTRFSKPQAAHSSLRFAMAAAVFLLLPCVLLTGHPLNQPSLLECKHKCCSRGDPRLKWKEIRLDKASDLGHCICLDGDPGFGLDEWGFPHCLARVPRGRGGYRFARSQAGLISAHFEYKRREFAAHEFEVSKAHGRANLQAYWVF